MSITALQTPVICPYPEPDQSIPCPAFPLLEDPYNITLHLLLGFPSGLFPSVSLTPTLYAPLLSLIHAPPITFLLI